MGRHDMGGPDEAGGAADLGAIVADDALLDALGRHHRPARSAAGSTPLTQPSSEGGHDGVNTAVPPAATDSALTDLFATWRAGLDAEPVPAPPSVDSVVLALRRTARRRSLRPILGVAVAICALLVGSATIGARTARPGDLLWPVTQVLWSDRAESVVAGDTTRVALGQARMALDSGLTIEARSALVVASTVLPRVAERDGRQNLKADLDNLWSTLDWVQQQRTATVSAAAPPAPSTTSQPDPGAAVGTDASSPPTSAGSSSLPATSTRAEAASSQPTVSSAGSSTAPSTVPAPTSAPLPPAPPSSIPPSATSPIPPTPTAPTPATAPTVPSTPGSTTAPTTSAPSSPAPSSDTSTGPSTADSPSDPSTTASSATQEVAPIAPTETTGVATAGLNGEQTVDPAQQVQQAPAP